MNKISVFDKLATRDIVENTNGIVLDSILITTDTDEDLEKDSYTLTAEFSTLDNLYKVIMEKSIIKVKLDYGYDYFVVKNIDYDEFEKTIEVICRHITEEAMLGLWIDNVAPTNLTGKDAIQWVYDRAIGTKEIEFISDITETMSADYVRMNMQEMLYNTTNGLLTKKVTGEVLRRGYTVYINKKVKFENGIEVRKGKNLTGFTGQEDCSNIVTRVNPISYNAPVTDVYVTSPLANSYKSIITKEIKYDNVRLASDVQETDENKESYTICSNEDSLREKLIELATKEFTENEIDKAQCEYDISFEDLSTTEEYKDYAILENVGTGEVVKVIVDTLGYDINARVIKRKYDVCKQKITSCTLSNVNKAIKPQGFYDIVVNTDNIIKDITDGNNIVAEKIKGYLNSRDVSIKASRKVAAEQDYIVAISECLDETSDLYGAIMWGTGGIYLSTQRTADNKDWDWTTAITSKGITADVIKTGILNAVKISNTDGSFYIDLSKPNGITFQNHGKDAIKIQNNKMIFYNLDGTSPITTISSEDVTASSTSETSKKLNIQTAANSMIFICGTDSSGESIPLIMLDANKFFSDFAIIVQKRALFWGGIGVTGGIELQSGDLTVGGNLSVTGNKNRVVETTNYSKRLLNAYETTECYFGDIGEATIGEDGAVKIEIDKIFLETVDTTVNYQVFTTKYGQGDCWVSERTETYFIIEGTPNLQVGYEIKAKQKDFINTRLEEFKKGE